MRIFFKRRVFRMLLTALLLFVGAQLCSSARADGFDVHYLNIGRYDGILIQCDGEYAFFDGAYQKQAKMCVSYMQQLGVDHLKYYIGTHGHVNHVSGAYLILNAFPTESVICPHERVKTCITAYTPSGKLRAVKNTPFIIAQVGQTFKLGGATIQVIGPTVVKKCGYNSIPENNNSLVLRVTYGNTTFVFTGDEFEEALRTIDPALLHCDVYKNGHHYSQVSADFLASIAPKYIVYSTGDEDLPTPETLGIARDLGCKALITAENCNGTIVFHSDGQHVSYRTTTDQKSVTFKEKEITIDDQKPYPMKVATDPAGFVNALVYSSDDPGIASVDSNGMIKGLSEGTTTLHATLSNGSTDECVVHVKKVGVTLNKTELTIVAGKSVKLTAKITPKYKLPLTWTTDDPAVATVTKNGSVKAVHAGETVVRATLPNGESGTCAVHVQYAKATGITLKPYTPKRYLGEQVQVTATVKPKTADPTLVWSSDNEAVATVDQNGLITTVGVGTTKIRVKSASGRKSYVTITVRAPKN